MSLILAASLRLILTTGLREDCEGRKTSKLSPETGNQRSNSVLSRSGRLLRAVPGLGAVPGGRRPSSSQSDREPRSELSSDKVPSPGGTQQDVSDHGAEPQLQNGDRAVARIQRPGYKNHIAVPSMRGHLYFHDQAETMHYPSSRPTSREGRVQLDKGQYSKT